MNRKRFGKRMLALSGLGLLAVLSSQVYAAGYKLEFQSPSALADAGDAAVVEDAGTNWLNSAGLVYLPQQLAAAGTLLYEASRFAGSATAASPFGGSTYAQSGHASSYQHPYIPAVHYSLPFAGRWAFGMSIVPAWGLGEDWKEHSLVRYDLTRIYTRTLDFAPSLALKINDHWSIGLGPDFNYFTLQNRNDVRTEGPAVFGGTNNDSISRVVGSGWGHGYHAGILFRINEATRIGLNYRSKIVMSLDGYSSFGYDGVTSYETNRLFFHTVFPANTSLSMYHDLNQRWAVMGTVAYDQWSVLRYNNVQNYQSLPTAGNPAGTINVGIPEFYNNTFDFSAGAHYKWNDALMLRGSFKFESTPTNYQTRNIEFPDSNKYGINIGARYQLTKKAALDLMYGHVFTRSTRINNTNPVSGENVNGHVTTGIDVAGGQLVLDL